MLPSVSDVKRIRQDMKNWEYVFYIRYVEERLGKTWVAGNVYNRTKTHWDPVTINHCKNMGFRTGCLVFTDLWSYVLLPGCSNV